MENTNIGKLVFFLKLDSVLDLYLNQTETYRRAAFSLALIASFIKVEWGCSYGRIRGLEPDESWLGLGLNDMDMSASQLVVDLIIYNLNWPTSQSGKDLEICNPRPTLDWEKKWCLMRFWLPSFDEYDVLDSDSIFIRTTCPENRSLLIS